MTGGPLYEQVLHRAEIVDDALARVRERVKVRDSEPVSV
jgi:hypothetical protein